MNEGAIRAALGGGVSTPAREAARRFAERAARDGIAEVVYATYDSPLGTGAVAATERGVLGVALPNQPVERLLSEIASKLTPRVLEVPSRLDAARRELDEYFAGERSRFALALDWRLVAAGFGGRVLRETAKVPYGVTATYGEIAARAGNPRAYRAAGSALGRNPIPLIVPCHRVLRSGGLIGHYGGGPEMKEFLLRLEGAVQP